MGKAGVDVGVSAGQIRSQGAKGYLYMNTVKYRAGTTRTMPHSMLFTYLPPRPATVVMAQVDHYLEPT